LLHNRQCHVPGVVPGRRDNLQVVARPRPDLNVEIQPGYAVDGLGRDLVLFEPVIKSIKLLDLKLPQTVYLVLRFVDELSDFITYRENAEYRGHRRVLESCVVEISQTQDSKTRRWPRYSA